MARPFGCGACDYSTNSYDEWLEHTTNCTRGCPDCSGQGIVEDGPDFPGVEPKLIDCESCEGSGRA